MALIQTEIPPTWLRLHIQRSGRTSPFHLPITLPNKQRPLTNFFLLIQPPAPRTRYPKTPFTADLPFPALGLRFDISCAGMESCVARSLFGADRETPTLDPKLAAAVADVLASSTMSQTYMQARSLHADEIAPTCKVLRQIASAVRFPGNPLHEARMRFLLWTMSTSIEYKGSWCCDWFYPEH